MQSPINVLFIVNGFPPANHSGTFRNAAFARHLPGLGVSLAIVCAEDNDRIFEYKSLADWHDDPRWLSVQRLPWRLHQPDKRSRLLRALRRLPVGWTVERRCLRRDVIRRVLPTALEAVAAYHPSVFYASAPPPEALLVARTVHERTGVPFVCDLRDPWTYYGWAKYRHWVDFLLERGLERSTLSLARRVIVNTPTAGRVLVTKVGIDPDKVVVLPNGYDEQEFANVGPADATAPGRFTIVYTGILAFHEPRHEPLKGFVKRMLGMDYRPVENDPNTRSPRWFLEAVQNLLDHSPEWVGRLRIVFAGSFSSEDRSLFQAFRYPACLEVLPPVSHAEALRLILQAQLCLLLQWEMKVDGRDCSLAVPGKLYDYLRSGTRIFAPMQKGDSQELIDTFRAGVVVPPRDVRQIETALRTEIERWERGEFGRQSPVPPGLERYERRNLAAELAEIFRAASA